MRRIFLVILLLANFICVASSAQTLGKGLMGLTGRTEGLDAQQEARAMLKMGMVEQAVRKYAEAVGEAQERRNGGRGVDGDLLAEYAYALALHHDFEGALVNIDRAWMLNAKHKDFFTAQILALMQYKSPAEQLVKRAKVPVWMDENYKTLIEKYATSSAINRDAPQTALKRATRLSTSGQTVQAIALFEELSKLYPRVYIIPLSYATVWERMGEYGYAAQLLKQGIGMMSESEGNRPVYTMHLQKVERKATQNRQWVRKIVGTNPPKLMTYVGGSVGKDYFSLDGKVGMYTSNKFSASLNIGIGYAAKSMTGSIGLSAYKTWGIFVAGMGINDQMGKSGNTFSLSPQVGLSFMNRRQTSSFDIMLGGYIPCTADGKFSYSLSVGKTIYFDLNKRKR